MITGNCNNLNKSSFKPVRCKSTAFTTNRDPDQNQRHCGSTHFFPRLARGCMFCVSKSDWLIALFSHYCDWPDMITACEWFLLEGKLQDNPLNYDR